MKKFILFLIVSLVSIISKSETTCIITACPSDYGCKFMVSAPHDSLICTKDSTVYAQCYGTRELTVAAAQAEFDSLYIILAITDITKFVNLIEIPTKENFTYKQNEKQLAYIKQ